MPNSYTKLLYHFVCGTKDRRPLISDQWRGELDRYIGGLVSEKGGELLEIGGMPDHVHLSIRSRPDISVSDLMCFIKANSSGWIHKEFPALQPFAWQSGYGAFSVSHSAIGDVKRYIANQHEHHRIKTFQEECREFLDRHEMDYDERYLWE